MIGLSEKKTYKSVVGSAFLVYLIVSIGVHIFLFGLIGISPFPDAVNHFVFEYSGLLSHIAGFIVAMNCRYESEIGRKSK